MNKGEDCSHAVECLLEINATRRKQQEFGYNLITMDGMMNNCHCSNTSLNRQITGSSLPPTESDPPATTTPTPNSAVSDSGVNHSPEEERTAQRNRTSRFEFNSNEEGENFIPSYANQVWIVGVSEVPHAVADSPGSQALVLVTDKYTQSILKWHVVPKDYFQEAQEDVLDSIISSALGDARKTLGIPTLLPSKLYLCWGPGEFSKSTTLSAICRFMEQELVSLKEQNPGEMKSGLDWIGQLAYSWNFGSVSQVCRYDLWKRSGQRLAATGRTDVFNGMNRSEAQSLADAAKRETQKMLESMPSNMTPNTSRARKRSNDELHQIVAN
eukprot:gb/GECG01005307.1/.p1 GENE.gb/GECG01005307.1/~~gb/GECG01005307.1/.p1  ORF type:complete len:327 (+),score=44.92 gb/GECG01005307.1/:1-981(+)